MRPPRGERAAAAALNAIWLVLIVAVGITVIYWRELTHNGFSYAVTMLAVVTVFFLAVFGWQLLDVRRRAHSIVAGARWVGLVADPGSVRLYELVKVEIDHIQTRRDGDAETEVLRLTDARGGVEIEPTLAEANPELWDLVYNGIRHSVAAGAEIDGATRERLRIDPALS